MASRLGVNTASSPHPIPRSAASEMASAVAAPSPGTVWMNDWAFTAAAAAAVAEEEETEKAEEPREV